MSKRYGQWPGNPDGCAENVTRCREEVWPTGRSMIPHQCNRTRGHGVDGAFCSQHSKSTKDIKPLKK